MDNSTATKNIRRYNNYTSTVNLNYIHLRNPWISAWWSAAFPGFGHLHLGIYVKGFILFFWEIIINVQTNLNLAMVYSFTGQFEKVIEVVQPRLLIIYIPVYFYCIWDSYRLTVDLNKHYQLAERENAPIVIFNMSGYAINSIDKRNPWLALVWSFLYPGLGSLYIHRLPAGFFAITWSTIIIYQSHLLEAVQHTLLGQFEQTISILNIEWALFFPSIYFFAAYESYVLAVEYNQLFKKSQRQFLQKNYANSMDLLLKNKGT